MPLLWSFNGKKWANSLKLFRQPSSGARAMGMGGAFIAVADDATAASWNPGGLIQLEKPEISLVYSYLSRTEDKDYEGVNRQYSSDNSSHLGLNYLSMAYPFELFRRNVVISLNYQHLYDFYHQWKYLQTTTYGTALYDYTQKGSLYALGIALGIDLSSYFSLGVTFNWWGDFIHQNKWKQKYEILYHNIMGGNLYTGKYVKVEEYSFQGYNTNVGFLWEISPTWKIGGVFKTSFDADINYMTYNDSSESSLSNPKFSDLKLDMPFSCGLGVAWSPVEFMKLSADLFFTKWNDFLIENTEGMKISPITGQGSESSDLKSTTWCRLGLEYIFETKKQLIPLRVGIFYDPAPSEGGIDDYYGFTLGSGIVSKYFTFDVALQYRWGNDVAASMPDLSDSLDLEEYKVYSSIIFYL